jgi:DNA repair and recombination RAD54-like protein
MMAKGRITVPVLIVSYETLRMHIDSLTTGPIGLVLCDEVCCNHSYFMC